MFNEIEDLTKEIEKFRTNIIGSEKLIDALNNVSTNFQLQVKKTDSTANDLKDTFNTLSEKVSNSHNSLIKKQNEISEKNLKMIEESSAQLNKSYSDINQSIINRLDETVVVSKKHYSDTNKNINNFLKEFIKSNEVQNEYIKKAFDHLDRRITKFYSKATIWLIILTGLGFILLIILIISLIL
jgi:chromosome segregation ATPase